MRFERVQFAVVGAGISGLACAHRLAALGGDVIVLEGSQHVGGRIETISRGGVQFECGPNTLMAGGRSSAAKALGELIDELELGGEIVEASPVVRRRYIGRANSLTPLPAGPVGAVMSPLLGPIGLARAAADLVLPARDIPGESVSGFIRRRFGRRILENMVAPFLSGVYAGDASRLEAEAVLATLVAAERERGSVIRGMLAQRRRQREESGPGGRGRGARARSVTFTAGMAMLSHRLHEQLGTRVALGARVHSLRERADGCELQLADGSRLRCEHAVIAADMAAAGRLLEGVPRLATLGLSLSEAPCASLAVVSMVLERNNVPHQLDGFGYLNQPGQGRRVLGCMFRSSIFAHSAKPEQVLLTAFVGGANHPEVVEQSDEALLKLVRAELLERLGIAAKTLPVDVLIRRWRRAIPQFNSGHSALRQRIAMSTVRGPISLVGNYVSGLSLPECIRGGREHAARLMPDAAEREEQQHVEATWVPPLSASS